MLNKSNNLVCLQKYIIKRMVEFFSKPSEVVTSRYVLYFDSSENIISFDNELRLYIGNASEMSLLKAILGDPNINVSIEPNYIFYNDDGGVEYEATQLRISNGSLNRVLVFIADYDKDGCQLGDAFKNKIRNEFVDKNETKILFYLSEQNIASVSKTTENFQRQGMPLSIASVYNYLVTQIHLVQGENQQEVLQYALNKIINNKPQNDNSLLDFAPIIRIIESQKLVQDDFHDLHMFPMELSDLGKNNSYLKDNFNLYRSITIALEDQELESVMSSYEPSIIKNISKQYERDEENWDKTFTYESIIKHKKVNTKKFKIEQPIALLDIADCALAPEYYLDFVKDNSASYIIYTKNYCNVKQFKLQVRFTQKANVVGTSPFKVESLNSKGNYYRIILDKSDDFYHGTIIFEGSKKTKITINVSVMNVPCGFFADACTGLLKDKSGIVYQLESNDSTITLGREGNPSNLLVNIQNPAAISWPVTTSNKTKITFEHSDDEIVKDYTIKLDLDGQNIQITTKVKFTEEKNRLLAMYELFNKCVVSKNVFSLGDEVINNKNKQSEKYATGDFNVSGNTYALNTLFKLESEIIKNKMLLCKTNGLKNPQAVSLAIPADVLSVLHQICDFYETRDIIPSLSHNNDDVIGLYKQYIDVILNHIGANSTEFADKQNISSDILNIFKIGMVIDSDNLIWLSPLNPLSVAYQVELSRSDMRMVELDDYLYSSLGFGNTIPFIEDDNGTVYQSIKGAFPLEWACYCDAAQSIKGEESTYVNKIEDYYSKFDYLFKSSSNNRIIINVINIHHTSEIVNALLKLYKQKPFIKALSIDINYYYMGTGRNDLEQMCETSYIERKATSYYGAKNTELIEGFCDWYSDKVTYYAMKDNNQYKYAHISFCAMQGDSNKNLHNTITSAKSGIMLGGLISDVPSYLDELSGIYKYGYGAEHTATVLSNSKYIQLANALNELAKCKEGSTATRNLSIAQGVQNTKSAKLDSIYKSSNWVVFVEPKIDLDFFIKQSESNEDDLIIIHYPDKNVSSTGYTSITVTQKSTQYIEVISAILHRELPMYTQNMDIQRVICDFNAYSGEWLMHFINQKQLEEKVSLVSAINFCRKYFEQTYPDYVWVPIALDEILRVTGSIGGSLTNVLFSKKVLINRGIIESQSATSDDLLMAGIKEIDGQTHVTYIPIEVKHGKCGTEIKTHAHNQVVNTADLIEKSFVDNANEQQQSIDKKIYRNYMVQHVISNVEKMLAYHIAETSTHNSIINSETRIKLMNDLYSLDICSDTDRYAFYFVEGATTTSKQQNDKDKVIEISTPVKNMYEFLINEDLVKSEVNIAVGSTMGHDSIDYGVTVPDEDSESEDIDIEDTSNDDVSPLQVKIEELSDIKEETGAPEPAIPQFTIPQNVINVAINENTETKTQSVNEINADSKGIEILLGNNDINGDEIIWQPNNTSQLFHTNTGIIGTMGTGKTQFTKSLITQLYKKQSDNVDGGNIGILIFDYKGDYNESKPDFIDATNATVLKPYHLPFNPLSLTQAKVQKPLLPIHTANAFKDTLAKIYNLGPKQQNALVKCINETYTASGIIANNSATWGNEAPTIEQVYHRYVNDEDIKKNDSLEAAMYKLAQYEIFEGNPSATKSLFELLNGVVVIDLSGYDEDIQTLIVAITLDLFYSQMQAAGSSVMHNGCRQLTKMILVDEADNFMSKGFPSLKKILKEGREFGVGTILSTQSLTHFGSGEDDYSKYILTWVVHNVSDLKNSDVDFVFNTEKNSQDSNMLFNQIKSLSIHHSIIKIGTGKPIYLHDKAFWELYKEIKNN